MSKRVIEPTFRTVSRICENKGQSALEAFKCLSHELAAILVVFVSQERNLIITIASAHIALD